MYARILVVISLLISTSPARADASWMCMWMLLTQSHAIVQQCKGSLDAAREQRYLELRREIETFVVANAHLSSNPLAANLSRDSLSRADQAFITSLQRRGDMFCLQSFADSQRLMQELTTAAAATTMKRDLATPRDPYSGDCI